MDNHVSITGKIPPTSHLITISYRSFLSYREGNETFKLRKPSLFFLFINSSLFFYFVLPVLVLFYFYTNPSSLVLVDFKSLGILTMGRSLNFYFVFFFFLFPFWFLNKVTTPSSICSFQIKTQVRTFVLLKSS